MALAIESGCEWITTDRDYVRFPIAGAVSLISWLGVLYFGRMLAFVGIN